MTTSSSWTNQIVSLDGIELHFTRTGGAKAPLISLHGITDNGLCWRRAATEWQADFDVIMVDVRGHGRSSAPDDDDVYTLASMREDVVGLIKILDLGRPGLVGHSMGALIASEVAAYYPDRVGFMILEDPPWDGARSGMTPEQRSQLAEEWRQGIIQNKSLTTREIIDRHKRERMEGGLSPWSEIDYLDWGMAKIQVSPHVVNLVSHGWPSWRTIVPNISCPTMLLYGDVELGSAISADVVVGVMSSNQKVNARQMQTVGHSLRREDFASYMEHCRRFFDGLSCESAEAI